MSGNKPHLQRAKAPTLNDVALVAGVSAQTVSRVINKKGDVSRITREKVEQAIAQLGYRPNAVARSLVSRKTKTIGLIVTDFAQGFFPDTTRTIELEAARRGYAVHIITASGEPGLVRTALERARDGQFAGIIVNTATVGFETDLQQAASEGFPVVLIHREAPGIPSTVLWEGYRKGAELAVDHLVSVGCRKIAFIATQNSDLVDADKLDGYRAALRRAGLAIDSNLVVHAPHSFQGGFNAIAEILHQSPDVDGVFSTSDVRAVGVLRSLAVSGMRVPHDVAVVAFGGSTMASMVTPSLSTIRVPRATLGALAVEALFDAMDDGTSVRVRHAREQPTLEIGESSLRNPFSGSRRCWKEV